MNEIYLNFSVSEVNTIFFAVLHDAMSLKMEHSEIFKTSWVGLAVRGREVRSPILKGITMSRTMLEICEDMQALDELMRETDDVSDTKVEEAINSWFAEFDKEMSYKADNYAALICEQEARAEVRREQADRMARLAKSDESSAKWLKDKLKAVMEMRGMKKLNTERFRITVAANGGKQPIFIGEPDSIDHKFCKHIPERYEPDTDIIRESLLSGLQVAGATLLPRGSHLRIA